MTALLVSALWAGAAHATPSRVAMDDFEDLTTDSWDTGTWTKSASDVVVNGVAEISPKSTEKYVQWDGYKAWDAAGTNVELWAKIDQKPSYSGSPPKGCYGAVGTGGALSSAQITSTGIIHLSLSPSPSAPNPLRTVKFYCQGGSGTWSGKLKVDWFVVTDSTTGVIPPVMDLSASWSLPNFAGGGVTSTLLARGPSNALWAGSDVGGMAYSTATPHALAPRNGNPAVGSLGREWDYHVWDINQVDTSHVFAITGDVPYGEGDGAQANFVDAASETWSLVGGLWRSDDVGASWHVVGENARDGDLAIEPDTGIAAPETAADIAASGRTTECNEDFAPAAGNLIAWKFDATYDPYHPGETPQAEHRVVYAASHVHHDGVGPRTLWVFAPDAAEPDDLCAPYDFDDAGALPDGIISAVVPTFTTSAAEGNVLVGMKHGPVSGLWLCDQINQADIPECGPASCVQVAGTEDWDVRDIARDNSLDNVFYVADGGRRDLYVDDVFTSVCGGEPEDAHIWRLTLTGSGSTQTSYDIAHIGETNGLVAPCDHTDMVNCANDAEIPGLTHAAGNYLFASFYSSRNAHNSPNLWRCHISSGDCAEWEPISAFSTLAVVMPSDSWMDDRADAYDDDQRMAPSLPSQLLVDDDGYLIVGDGSGVWQVDSFDSAPEEMQWTYIAGDFQTSSPTALAVPVDVVRNDQATYLGASDIFLLDSPLAASQAERSCHWDHLHGSPIDVSRGVAIAAEYYLDPGVDSVVAYVASSAPGDHAGDSYFHENSMNHIVRTMDDGETWCVLNSGAHNDTGQFNDECDGATVPPCGDTGDSGDSAAPDPLFHMGSARALALDPAHYDTIVGAFFYTEEGEEGDYDADLTGGLWFSIDGGIHWVAVHDYTPGTELRSECSKVDFFSSNVSLSVVPDSGDYDHRVLMGSGDPQCGLVDVGFDDDGTALWTSIYNPFSGDSYGDCDLYTLQSIQRDGSDAVFYVSGKGYWQGGASDWRGGVCKVDLSGATPVVGNVWNPYLSVNSAAPFRGMNDIVVAAAIDDDQLEFQLNHSYGLPAAGDSPGGTYLLERIYTSTATPPVESWRATPIGVAGNPSLASFLVAEGTEDFGDREANFMVAPKGQGVFKLTLTY